MARIGARGWAWGIAAAATISQVAWVLFLWHHLDQVPTPVADQLPVHVASLALLATIPVVGALILTRHPRHMVAWVLTLAAATAWVGTRAARWRPSRGPVRFRCPSPVPDPGVGGGYAAGRGRFGGATRR